MIKNRDFEIRIFDGPWDIRDDRGRKRLEWDFVWGGKGLEGERERNLMMKKLYNKHSRGLYFIIRRITRFRRSTRLSYDIDNAEARGFTIMEENIRIREARARLRRRRRGAPEQRKGFEIGKLFYWRHSYWLVQCRAAVIVTPSVSLPPSCFFTITQLSNPLGCVCTFIITPPASHLRRVVSDPRRRRIFSTEGWIFVQTFESSSQLAGWGDDRGLLFVYETIRRLRSDEAPRVCGNYRADVVFLPSEGEVFLWKVLL